MDSLSALFPLTGYFVSIILVIVLLGILLGEYFTRQKEEKKGIFGWLIVLFLGSIYAISDGYSAYFGIYTGPIYNVSAIFAGLTLIGTLIQSILTWDKINKNIFWTLIIFGTSAISIIEITRIYFNIFLNIFNIFSLVFTTMTFYFLVISFLIAGHKAEKSKVKLRKKLNA